MKSLILTPLLALAISLPAHGALLLSENFDNLNTGALNGQNSWSAAGELTVGDGGLSYSNGDITIAGGARHSVSTGANAQGVASKAFASQSGEVWFSLTLNVSTTTNSNRFWFHVSDDADLNDSGVIGQTNTSSTALLGGVRIGSSQQSTSTGISLGSNLGTTFFVVGRYFQAEEGGTATVGDYDSMEVWVNPDSTTLGSGVASSFTTGSGITGGIDTFALSALGGGATVLWDNLLVGTSQADVLDVYTSTIPEPSSFAALGGLAALGLAAAGRRRRR
ncbi:MAG: PEP-CTERM sorting domain-containing protein [Verrucomicrobiota bacterium]